MRNQWPMAKVIVIYKSNDGHVRTVKFVLEITNLIRLVRPIYMKQVLSENDEVRFPDGETDSIYNQDNESS